MCHLSKGYSYPGNSSFRCVLCPKGQFQPKSTEIFASCKGYSIGMFSAFPGSQICGVMSQGDCPPGSEFSSASSIADSGNGSTKDDGICTLCNAGQPPRYWQPFKECQYMSAPEGNSTCPPGMAFRSDSAKSRIDDRFYTMTVREACQYLQNGFSPTNCTACLPGTTTAGAIGSDRAEDCVCNIGLYLAPTSTIDNRSSQLQSSSACTPCPANTFKSAVGNAKDSGCTPCPKVSKTLPGITGATDMMACHCESPQYNTTHADGETIVTITSPTDGAHVCVVYAIG